ncbi:hypothetical protein FJ976_18655 [Mesorhizobium sp. B1-1-9]|uniref:hypothetical protein n=1 Tax=Mesorhizobium sp. B1-1-9 TaxID=2589975 RepID=UPI00112AAC6E|nr:hypothetical protein [Mesorhizobium sp. B1-1-9]TPN48427.1 hypothetical protein FJ976_18655 [Mesorhizobium sp. B1-1-9]
MTTISEPGMPAIDVGKREQAAVDRPGNTKAIGVVAAGALLITLVNMAAAIYLYRGINDLRSVEARLEQLGAFEQRIAARLDTVNNGFQSRFEKLDSQLQGNFNEINGSLARLEQSPPAVAGNSPPNAAEQSEVTTSAVAEAPEALDSETASEVSVDEAARPPKRRIASAPPPPNSNYQRIEQPDGKVYYRKIN